MIFYLLIPHSCLINLIPQYHSNTNTIFLLKFKIFPLIVTDMENCKKKL